MIIKIEKPPTAFQKYFVLEADEPAKLNKVDRFKVSPSSRRRDFSSMPEPESEDTAGDTENEPISSPSMGSNDSFSGDDDNLNSTDDTGTQSDDQTTDQQINNPETAEENDENSPTTDDTSDFSNDDDDDESAEDDSNTADEEKEVDEQDEDGMKKFILYKKYIRLYENVKRYIDRLETMMQNDIHKNMIISNTRTKLQELQTMMCEYMLYKFSDEKYIQSLLFFQSCVAVVHLSIEALQSIKIAKEDNNI